jgi:hypothetical protein
MLGKPMKSIYTYSDFKVLLKDFLEDRHAGGTTFPANWRERKILGKATLISGKTWVSAMVFT